jgi:hypothetical protein
LLCQQQQQQFRNIIAVLFPTMQLYNGTQVLLFLLRLSAFHFLPRGLCQLQPLFGPSVMPGIHWFCLWAGQLSSMRLLCHSDTHGALSALYFCLRAGNLSSMLHPNASLFLFMLSLPVFHSLPREICQLQPLICPGVILGVHWFCLWAGELSSIRLH